MTDQEPYELVLTPPARRALTDQLPEPVAAAVIDFLTTALVANPRRVGKPLRGELSGIWSARRRTYRALYRVREDVSPFSTPVAVLAAGGRWKPLLNDA